MSERTDRALRDISGAFDAVRTAHSADIPVAGTAILVRDGARGPEVLMMQRPDRGSFAGAWVFPGGKVESGDRLAGDAASAGPAGSETADVAIEIAVARRAAARETAEEVGLELAVQALQVTSCWDPPPGIRKRIRTWFYVAGVDDATLTLSPDEVVAARWARPEDVLDRHGRGGVTLYPPTWVTLHELCGARDVAALLEAVHTRGVRTFASLVRTGPAGPVFLWQPDAAYDPGVALDAPGPRNRLDAGALPWRYTRTD